MTAALAAVLLLLHGPDGHEIRINPRAITSMRSASPASQPNKAFTDGVMCMVSLSDGKFVTVAETCEAVQAMVEPKADRAK